MHNKVKATKINMLFRFSTMRCRLEVGYRRYNEEGLKAKQDYPNLVGCNDRGTNKAEISLSNIKPKGLV